MSRSFPIPDPLPLSEQRGQTYPSLVALMQRLLAENGCPWDREQDMKSLRRYVLEEACEVIDAIDALGIAKDTMFLFGSDNGPEFRRPWRGTAGMWTGTYHTSMEGSLRVPCMIKWPGKIPSRASNEMVSNWRSQAYELIDPTRFSWFRGVAGQYSFTDCW